MFRVQIFHSQLSNYKEKKKKKTKTKTNKNKSIVSLCNTSHYKKITAFAPTRLHCHCPLDLVNEYIMIHSYFGMEYFNGTRCP